MGKEKIARNEQFLLFPQCFLLNRKKKKNKKTKKKQTKKKKTKKKNQTKKQKKNKKNKNKNKKKKSPFVSIFDFISLFAAELQQPKGVISGKGSTNFET